MSQARTSVALIVLTIGIVICALVFSELEIRDPELRSAVYLVASIIGAVVIVILLVLMANAAVLSRLKAKAPHLYDGYRNFGRILAVALMATIGLVNFLVFAFETSRRIDYWSLGIAAIFGGLLAFCLRYVLKVMKAYRRLQSGR